MKKILISLCVLLFALLLLMWLPGDDPFSALSGCCKQRNSYEEDFRPTDRSFAECREMNDKVDKDDMYDPRGLWWWDVRCR